MTNGALVVGVGMFSTPGSDVLSGIIVACNAAERWQATIVIPISSRMMLVNLKDLIVIIVTNLDGA
jgi:hypothetical protein